MSTVEIIFTSFIRLNGTQLPIQTSNASSVHTQFSGQLENLSSRVEFGLDKNEDPSYCSLLSIIFKIPA